MFVKGTYALAAQLAKNSFFPFTKLLTIAISKISRKYMLLTILCILNDKCRLLKQTQKYLQDCLICCQSITTKNFVMSLLKKRSKIFDTIENHAEDIQTNSKKYCCQGREVMNTPFP